ncbi:hypothetical protein X742_19770 [Mesorhizobium sp. LNHC232B00]|nr:hypothetical protein X742_19770 [Mesorhizobium sp. LNHC232B00]
MVITGGGRSSREGATCFDYLELKFKCLVAFSSVQLSVKIFQEMLIMTL